MCLVFFEGGLQPPSFLEGMWFCFVFCVGYLFRGWGMSYISEGFVIGACLAFLKSDSLGPGGGEGRPARLQRGLNKGFPC